MAKKATPFGPQDGDKTDIAVQRPTVNALAGQRVQRRAAAANLQPAVLGSNSQPIGNDFKRGAWGTHGLFD